MKNFSFLARQSGMTIKELVIVLGIITTLVGVAFPLFNYVRDNSNYKQEREAQRENAPAILVQENY